MSGVFITATGTDIGKTFLATALIRHYRRASLLVHAIKPVLSGFDPDAFETSDPAALLGALGQPIALPEIERVSPWRFKAPLSPDMAAGKEGRTIPFPELVDFCRKEAARAGTVLIEGIGGIMVPIDQHRTVLDWMSVLRMPILLVAGTYVGTISHTLTALEVLARRNLNVAAVVVSESGQSAASLEDTVGTLERFADSIDVIGIARLAGHTPDHPAVARIAALI